MNERTPIESWWTVETKDKAKEEYYQVGGKWPTQADAEGFVNACLSYRRSRYARIIHYELFRTP